MQRLIILIFTCSFYSFGNLFADESRISAVRYSPDGKLLAAGSDDGRIVLYEIKSGKALWSLPGKGRQILSLQFRKANDRLLAFERNGLIILVDAGPGRVLKRIQPDFRASRNETPEGLAAAELDETDDVLALAGGFFPVIYLLDASRALDRSDEPVREDGTYKLDLDAINVSRRDQEFKRSPTILRVLYAPSGNESFTRFSFSNRQRTVIAANEARLLLIWKWDDSPAPVTTKTMASPLHRKFGRSDDGVNTGVAIGAKGQFVTVGYTRKYGGIQLWDLARSEMISPVDYFHPGGTANRAIFNRAGDLVITSDEVVNCVWKNQSGKLKRLFRIHHDEITGMDDRPSAIGFSPDDTEIAVGIQAAIGRIDMKTMKLIGYVGQPRPEKALEITPEE